MDMEQLSHSVSLSPGMLRFTLVVLLLLVNLKPVEGQSIVVGSPQPIVAAPGDDVILPCHVEPPLNVAGLTVEWLRPDLRPDPKDRLSRVEYVHLYRDRREVPDMKMSSYLQRTTLFTDGLRRGNISLKIINVTLADEGRFRCFIPKLKSQKQFSIVELVVAPKSVKTSTTETPQQPSSQTPYLKRETDVNGGLASRSRPITIVVFCIVLVILGVMGVTGYFMKNCQKQKHIKVPRVDIDRCSQLNCRSSKPKRPFSKFKRDVVARYQD